MTENRSAETALRLTNLQVHIDGRMLVNGVSLSVAPGEVLALVGESGAGKSLTARALLGLVGAGARVASDELLVAGVNATAFTERQWRKLRGAQIALVSQDALVSLDPLRRIEAEVAEPLVLHGERMPRAARRARVKDLLEDVAMPEPERRARQYPHELSGGLRQRALIASALAGDPAVIVADEPTTALDATVQARVLALLRSIADRGVAIVFISHDLAAVAHLSDRIAVMQAGRIVEEGSAAEVLGAPQHPHTALLVAAAQHRPATPREPSSDQLLRVDAVTKSFDRPVVRNVSLTLARGRTLAVVGESGSGKTTLARMIIGVESPDSGTITALGAAQRSRAIQYVHQNPLGAFDPRWTVGRSLREALAAGGTPRAARTAAAAALLNEVNLDSGLLARRPSELSGGQRQRAAIARALAASPEILVLDEPVSALDPSVREKVLALLARLQRERDLGMIFISHDLHVVAAIADDVAVMQDGVVVEHGLVSAVFAAPQHPFTQELLAAGLA
jgi:peptide/nickel transport system ATP-binding protein